MTDPAALPPLALGALPPKLDERTLMLADFLTPTLPPPPTAVDWTPRVAAWPLFQNDKVGDCTCAEAGHLTLGWSSDVGRPVTLTDDDVLAAYSAVTGYDPVTGANDNGAYVLDVLNFWRRTGIGGHQITAYAKLDHRRRLPVKQAVALLGGAYMAFALPLSARDQIHAGRPWSLAVGPNARRGTWGGHAAGVFGYDAREVRIVTWGRVQRATWQWVARYASEGYGIVAPDFLDGAGRDLDLPAMLAQLRAVTGR